MNIERIELMKAQREAGKSFTDLGRIFGISRQRAHQILSPVYKEKIQDRYKSVRLSPTSLDSDTTL